jgi:hypothetical protein
MGKSCTEIGGVEGTGAEAAAESMGTIGPELDMLSAGAAASTTSGTTTAGGPGTTADGPELVVGGEAAAADGEGISWE